MKTFDNYLKEQLEDKEFKNEYENIQPELDIIRAMVSARTSQNLTQKQLSEKTGIDQSDISKLENGTRNPSINLLKREFSKAIAAFFLDFLGPIFDFSRKSLYSSGLTAAFFITYFVFITHLTNIIYYF